MSYRQCSHLPLIRGIINLTYTEIILFHVTAFVNAISFSSPFINTSSCSQIDFENINKWWMKPLQKNYWAPPFILAQISFSWDFPLQIADYLDFGLRIMLQCLDSVNGLLMAPIGHTWACPPSSFPNTTLAQLKGRLPVCVLELLFCRCWT